MQLLYLKWNQVIQKYGQVNMFPASHILSDNNSLQYNKKIQSDFLRKVFL